ncbi:hypothetical protein TWF694_007141 [Orbilia ellipsospora]|uniref:Uncharacterized protein n=1 Tax=Orbilia ellipsospora TaxID=2528407 RepID=A0AAV9WWX6_9PEZI
MNVARLLRPRHLFSRSPLSRSPLPLPRHFTAPPSLPINGTMDQKIEFLMIKAIDLNKVINIIPDIETSKRMAITESKI